MIPQRRFAAAFFLGLGLLWAPAAGAQKLVWVVRHAERADGGAPQMQGNPDPSLSDMGAARAANLARMLADANIKAIYATEYRRTQETGKPLATKLGIEVRLAASGDVDGLVSRLAEQHREDIVLVIGHSNTVPAVLKALGGPEVTIADDEYDNLFLIVPGTGVMTRIRIPR